MTDLDISRLTRLLPIAMAANPRLQDMRPLLHAADGDGQANDEDRVLNETEATNYLRQLRQDQQRTLDTFNRFRGRLAGSLTTAQSLVRSEPGGELLGELLQRAATQDSTGPMVRTADRQRLAGELSAPEIESLADHLENMNREAEHLTVDGIFRSARQHMSLLEELESNIPEAFLPTSTREQRAPIDLNFLKSLTAEQLAALSNQTPQNGEEPSILPVILRIAGINPTDQSGNWSLSFEQLQAFRTFIQQRSGQQLPESSEQVMAQFRFVAYQLRADLNEEVARRDAANPANSTSVSVQALIDRRDRINSPAVDQVLEIASDGTLTSLEVERSLLLEEQRRPGFLRQLLQDAPPATEGQSEMDRATAHYMSEVRSMVERYSREIVIAQPVLAAPEEPTDPDLVTSRQVLVALEHMRDGFTHRDRDYAERNAMVGLIDTVSYVVTFGGLLSLGTRQPLTTDEAIEYGPDFPRFGSTYRDAVRERVAEHHNERSRALEALREVIESPPSDFHGPRTIPAALEYLRTHSNAQYRTSARGVGGRGTVTLIQPNENPRYYELLTGDFFQANRLWEIHNQQNSDRQATMWYDFAQNLREGRAGGWWSNATHADGVRNFDFARSILYSLRAQSSAPGMRHRATTALADSVGGDILDEQGHVLVQTGGEFGFNPFHWFRNYSDEAADAVASDVVALAASIYIGNGGGAMGRSLFTAAGRSRATQGLLGFFAVRGTQAAVATEAAVGTAVASSGGGLFARALSRFGGPLWAESRVASCEAALRAAQATNVARNIVRAENALARARRLQNVLTAPTFVAGVEATVPRLTGRAAAIVNAHPPVPTFVRQAAAGTGVRSRIARGVAATLENFRLRSIGTAVAWGVDQGIWRGAGIMSVYDRTRSVTPSASSLMQYVQQNPGTLDDYDHRFDLNLRTQPRAR